MTLLEHPDNICKKNKNQLSLLTVRMSLLTSYNCTEFKKKMYL